jgi:hypothetical protein
LRSRIASVLAVGVVLVATAVLSASAAPKPQPPPVKAETCGVWRWPVKTLSDDRANGVNYHPKYSGIQPLRKVFAPGGLSETAKRIRKSPEMRTFRIHGDLIKSIREPDHDIHLVISVPGHRLRSLIVEFPDVACKGADVSKKKALIAKARGALLADCGDISSSGFTELNGTATITGVGFFDESHGQTGASPNGIELHPALSYSGNCSQQD